MKVSPGSRPIIWHTLRNQYKPTETCASSSSATLATMSADRWSPKPDNLWTNLGPASRPLASYQGSNNQHIGQVLKFNNVKFFNKHSHLKHKLQLLSKDCRLLSSATKIKHVHRTSITQKEAAMMWHLDQRNHCQSCRNVP